MKVARGVLLGMMAMACGVTIVGCGKKPEPGLAERTGAKLDQAAKKGAEKAEVVAEKAKEITGKAVEKTGEAVEKVGAAVEKAGEKLQK